MPKDSSTIEKINSKFQRLAEIIIKIRWLVIIGLAVIVAAGVIGLMQLRVAVSIDSFFLDDDPIMIAKENFEKTFGNDQFVGVLIEVPPSTNENKLEIVRTNEAGVVSTNYTTVVNTNISYDYKVLMKYDSKDGSGTAEITLHKPLNGEFYIQKADFETSFSENTKILLKSGGFAKLEDDSEKEEVFAKCETLIKSSSYVDGFESDKVLGVYKRSMGSVFTFEALDLIRDIGHDLRTNLYYSNAAGETKTFVKDVTSLADFDYTIYLGDEFDTVDVGEQDFDKRTQNLLNEIQSRLDEREGVKGKLYSKDDSQTWIIISLKEYPKVDDPKNWQFDGMEPTMYVGKLTREVLEKYRGKGYRITAAGLPINYYRKNVETFEDMKRVLIIASIIALVFIIAMVRSVPGVTGTIFVTFSSIVIIFGTMGWTDMAADTAFMLVPMLLTIAVSIGYTIHVTTFFRREFRRTGKRKESVCYAVKETGWPILFTALTTVLALVSFLIVPIQTIRWVGTASALSIIVVYFVLMLFYVSLLSIGKDKEPAYKERESGENVRGERIFGALSSWVYKHGGYISVIFAVVLASMIFGITQVEVDLTPRKIMGLKLPHVRDQIHVGESKIGTMYSYDIVLRFEKKTDYVETVERDVWGDIVGTNTVKRELTPFNDPVILRKIESLSEEITKEARWIKRAESFADIVKDYYQTMKLNNPDYYKIPSSNDGDVSRIVNYIVDSYVKLNTKTNEQGIVETNNPWANKDMSQTRISVKLSDYSTKAIKEHMDWVESRITEYFPKSEYEGFEYDLVGSVLQLSIMNQYITRGLVSSFLLALVIITVLMMVVFANIRLGLIAMIPNVAPALVAGGLMGFMGAPLEFVTMTIAPMVLGLAVDDTIHFISHSKLEFHRTGSYYLTIRNTFYSVGKALTKTTLIICFTFAAFLTANVTNMVNMGIYTIAAILAALIADFFVTPTLIKLTKPFGDERENIKPADNNEE